jgi:hypothetical protein
MLMKRTLLYLHVAFVLGANFLFAVAWLSAPRMTHVEIRWLLARAAVGLLAAMGVITGFGEMVGRRGKSEEHCDGDLYGGGVYTFLLCLYGWYATAGRYATN